jgi:cyanophycinase
VLAALRGADGIFIAGGDQSNYIRYWKGTAVQQALNEHARAGRPIGGSSAGLAILGHYGYTAMDGGSLESKVALADPFSAGVTLESNFMHLRGLEEVITDSHFSARSRLGRLIVFLGRLNQGLPETRIFGLGVDEDSALLVDGTGLARLAAGSAGSAWLVQQTVPAQVLAPGQPLSIAGIQITRLGPASLLDLATRKVTQSAATTVASVHQGVPAPDALTQKMMLRDKVPPDET